MFVKIRVPLNAEQSSLIMERHHENKWHSERKGDTMRVHKHLGMAACATMLMAGLTGVCKPLRKTHEFWGTLSILCMSGAFLSGERLKTPQKKTNEEQ